MGTDVLKVLAVSLLLAIFFLGTLHAYEASSDDDKDKQKLAHHELLSQVLYDGSSALDRIVYSYMRSINGFAARLTEQEKQKLSGTEGVLSVFPSRTYQLQTTRSWDFHAFPKNVRRSLPTEGDVIVGMLDTALWPGSPSSSDDSLGPPPARWKGACLNFTCNNKIIGARAYRQGLGGLSPVDT
ncbi:Subtilisin-like protease SBT4.9 [Dichanthelium oligosanthes]|uniref:Subtilisin-like protease SBT4.9 n=1 Tax=Dichanthelium oligosanthes TaxID=888268 RepID=A0A1E5VH47_9POAL|nr:Subtilisin-like protease SBT4.9 [Dichanthelium oligosanthes]